MKPNYVQTTALTFLSGIISGISAFASPVHALTPGDSYWESLHTFSNSVFWNQDIYAHCVRNDKFPGFIYNETNVHNENGQRVLPLYDDKGNLVAKKVQFYEDKTSYTLTGRSKCE